MTGDRLTDEVPRRSVLKYGMATSGALTLGPAMTARAAAKGGTDEGGPERRMTVVVLSGEIKTGRVYEIIGTVEEDGHVYSPGGSEDNSVTCYTVERCCSNGAANTVCVAGELPIDSVWEVTERGVFCDEEREPPAGESGRCTVRIRRVDGCPEE